MATNPGESHAGPPHKVVSGLQHSSSITSPASPFTANDSESILLFSEGQGQAFPFGSDLIPAVIPKKYPPPSVYNYRTVDDPNWASYFNEPPSSVFASREPQWSYPHTYSFIRHMRRMEAADLEEKLDAMMAEMSDDDDRNIQGGMTDRDRRSLATKSRKRSLDASDQLVANEHASKKVHLSPESTPQVIHTSSDALGSNKRPIVIDSDDEDNDDHARKRQYRPALAQTSVPQAQPSTNYFDDFASESEHAPQFKKFASKSPADLNTAALPPDSDSESESESCALEGFSETPADLSGAPVLSDDESTSDSEPPVYRPARKSPAHLYGSKTVPGYTSGKTPLPASESDVDVDDADDDDESEYEAETRPKRKSKRPASMSPKRLPSNAGDDSDNDSEGDSETPIKAGTRRRRAPVPVPEDEDLTSDTSCCGNNTDVLKAKHRQKKKWYIGEYTKQEKDLIYHMLKTFQLQKDTRLPNGTMKHKDVPLWTRIARRMRKHPLGRRRSPVALKNRWCRYERVVYMWDEKYGRNDPDVKATSTQKSKKK